MPPLDDNRPGDSDDLEQQLRRALQGEAREIDVESFLSDVHRGSRRRRNRRAIAGSVVAVSVIAVGAYGVMASGALDNESTPSANSAATDLTASTTGDESTESTAPTEPTVANGTVKGGTFLSLSATGTTHQYVLLARKSSGCGSGGCVEVDTTVDAGKTWQGTAELDVVPAIPDPYDESVNEVRFAGDGTDGWVYGGALRATHDGGATWEQPDQPFAGIVTDLEAWGDYVYATLYDDPSGSTTMFRSPIGEDAWQGLDLGMTPSLTTSLVVSQRLVAVLASPTPLSDGNQLLTSSDGTHWTQSDVCSSGQYPSDLSTTGESLWAVCSDDQRAYAVVTQDRGESWTAVPGEFSPGSLVAARDAKTAVIADAYQTGLTIVAEGTEPARVTAPGLNQVIPIGFTNPSTGYLKNADGQVLRTTDGGATWQPYPLPE